jgi:hypothetical protein
VAGAAFLNASSDRHNFAALSDSFAAILVRIQKIACNGFVANCGDDGLSRADLMQPVAILIHFLREMRAILSCAYARAHDRAARDF